MSAKFIPFTPDPVKGQAILNFTRTLRYYGDDKVRDHIRRGMPRYEMELKEQVGADAKTDNLVIRGECLSACAYLKDKGVRVDLVYIDPPFASGVDYAKKVYLRRNPLKDKSGKVEEGEQIDDDRLAAFEEKMYGDVWEKEKYLNWMYENLCAIKSVMSDDASIYVHLDWHIGHYVKVLLDEIFGEDGFVNEVVWHYYNKMAPRSECFPRSSDRILVYAKGDKYVFHTQYEKREHVKKMLVDQIVLVVANGILNRVVDNHVAQHRLEVAQLHLDQRRVIFLDDLVDLFLVDLDVIDDDLLRARRQIRHRLMQNPEHERRIQHARGRIHQIRNIDRNHPQPGIMDRPFPERIKRVLIPQTGNKRLDFIHRLNWIAIELNSILHVKAFE